MMVENIDKEGPSAFAPGLRVPKNPGLSRGRSPLTSIPASAACTPKWMKAAGFLALHALPPGNAQRFRQSVHPQKSGSGHFFDKQMPGASAPGICRSIVRYAFFCCLSQIFITSRWGRSLVKSTCARMGKPTMETSLPLSISRRARRTTSLAS